jgi:hypothetical protein
MHRHHHTGRSLSAPGGWAQFAHTPQAIRGYQRVPGWRVDGSTMRRSYPLVSSGYRVVLLWEQGVASSNLAVPTSRKPALPA